jgi:hypothetical protein
LGQKRGLCKIYGALMTGSSTGSSGEPHLMHNSMQNPTDEIQEAPREMPRTDKKRGVKRATKSLCWSAFWPGLALACLIMPALPIFGGCDMIVHAPEPEPSPTPVPDVPIHPDVYKPLPVDPATVKVLTDTSTVAPNLVPDYYQLVGADGGDMLTLQAYRLTPEGQPYIAPLDKPVKVKLGGIICPLKGEPGWAEAQSVTTNWLSGRQLQLDEDKRYPVTIDGRNIVQIRIKSEIKTKDKAGNITKIEEERPFNQLLVRAGYAFVDLVSPTSFDYKAWIVDEEYARGKRTEPAAWQLQNLPAGQPTPTPVPGIPVGLWAKGIFPMFRGPAVGRKTVAVIEAAPAANTKGKKAAAAVVTKQTKETVIKNP